VAILPAAARLVPFEDTYAPVRLGVLAGYAPPGT
jgi:hypothetical protein